MSRLVKTSNCLEQRARDLALRLLGRREYAASELLWKLKQRGLAHELAAKVVRELGEAGWQSDIRFAREYAAVHVARGEGPLKIRTALQAKDVAESTIEAALAEFEQDWLALACRLRAKRFGPRPPAEADEQARQMRFLLSRGFPFALARQAVRRHDDHLD